MCRIVEEAAQRAATLERSIRARQASGSGSGSYRLPQHAAGVSKGKAPAGHSSSGFGKCGQKLKKVFKGKGRGGRQQFQQGRGYKPEVEELQQSTARQPTIPPGYMCYNCNQPRHLIRNCPYPREYGYGRGVQQQQPQQPLAGRGGGASQHALLVGGTDTSSRHWSPASPFQCLTLGCSGQRPQSLLLPYLCGLLELGEFPTEPVTSEAHPYSPHVKARRRFRYHLLVQGRSAAVLGQHLQQCSFRSSVVSFFSCTSLPRTANSWRIVSFDVSLGGATPPRGWPLVCIQQGVASFFLLMVECCLYSTFYYLPRE
ncbi:hypothetical protein Taro_049606 [Colocasia esculenta]|uniref:CCHC-type domain-containing protein n=1 Tax=Colocasia esculenta TaxID=4460 RepID=A0A843XBB8_COLES|nr:hypothetical protein [Colocasia esculenta]